MFQRLAKNKWVSRFRLDLFKHLEGVMVLKCKECLRDQAAPRPLAFTLLPACSGCFSRKLLRTSKLSVVTHRTFAYFLGQVQLNCSNQYTKAATLVIFRLLLTNCRDFYFQDLVLYSSLLFFFVSLRVFILSLSPAFFFLCSRDFPVNQFNPSFLPSISTKIARNKFQLPLYYSYFGITEFSRSNTGFLF